MDKLILILGFVFIWFSGYTQQVVTAHEHPGITFTENTGQWEKPILFKAGLDGGALFLEADRLTFNFYDKYKSRKFHFNNIKPGTFIDDIIKGHAYHVVFDGCNKVSTIEKLHKGSYYENFFIGDDPTKWKSEVSNYHQLFYRELYTNIDYEILTSVTNVKYNFHVKPGGNPNEIKLHYEGIENVQLKKGVLLIKPEVNELFEQKPYAYQVINGETKEVPCNFVLKDHTVSYEFPKGYNKNYELVIDPLLVFAAQSGSTADNFGMTATFDSQGNLYSGGTIFDIGFPTTTGAYSASFFGPAYYGNTDVVVTKYSSNGTSLLYSTYYGGNRTESINSLIIDHNNNLCFYGVTSSNNFPTTTNSYDNTFNGGQFVMFVNNGLRFNNGTDIYVSKFNSSGTALLASTYIGGNRNDGLNQSDAFNYWNVPVPPPGTGSQVVAEPKYDSLQHNYGDQSRGEIQVDAQNNIYVASSTRSPNFPTVNAFDNSLGGKQDGVLFKFNPSLSNLLFSSFIGGSSTDAGYGVVIDNNFDIYVAGGTTSNDLPFTSGGYQPAYGGGNADGYLLRLSSGNSVLGGTYFGTAAYDQTYFIQSDKQNNIYVYGQSLGNMPVMQAAASSTVFNVPKTHQFISRFDKTLTTLNMSTVFGNDTLSTDISPSAFSVDKCSNIYLSGWGSSLFTAPHMTNMPLLSPTQSTTDGSDFYFMGLDSNAAALKYGSYFGGGLSREHVDGGTSRFDPLGKIYQSVCAGCGGNDDFPVTPGAWPCINPGDCPPGPNFNSNCNNGVIKVDFQLVLAISTINTNTLSGCAPLTVNFNNASPGLSYMWYLTNTDTTSVNPSPSMTYTAPGTYSVALIVYNPLACNIKDSSVTYITVYPYPVAAFTSTSSACSNTIVTTNNSTGNFGSNPFAWNWGDSSPTSTLSAPSHTYNTTGPYTVSLTVTSIDGCSATTTNTLSVFNFTTAVSSGSMCAGATTNLNAQGGTSYTWQPAATVSNSTIANPVSNASATTVYTVQIDNNTPGYTCSSTLTTQVIVRPDMNADFNFTATPCTDSVLFLNTSTTAATSPTVTWNFAGTHPPTTNTAVTQTYANGNYSVTLVGVNEFGCTDSITKSFSIFSFTAAVTSNSICAGSTASLTAQGGTSYTWQPAAAVSNSVIANPTTNPSVTSIYTVQVDNNSPGFTCSKTLTTQVVVRPAMLAGFNMTVVPCTDTVKLINTSTTSAPTQTVTWNFGGGQAASSNTAVTQTYANGNYSVSLLAVNNFGCRDSIVKPISVFNFTTGIVAGDSICRGFTSQLNASGGTSYTWSPAATLSNPSISSPVSTPSATTVYSVTIQNNSPGYTCARTLTTSILVYPKINTAFTYTIGACSNDVQFTDASTVAPVSWQWDFGDTHTSTTQNPLYFYSVSGTYTASLISTNSFGCRDTAEQVIALPAFTPISVSNSVLKCQEDTVQLNATGGVFYSWQPASSLSNATIANPLASPTVSTVYTVTIKTLKGTDTCQSILTTAVTIYPFAFNSSSITVFPSTLTLGQSASVTLNGLPLNSTLTVVPNTNVSPLLGDVFIISPTKSGEYAIYATDQNNCYHFLRTIYVEVITNACNDDVVYLPTGFTPNNDGVNDVLYIRSNFITDVYLTIYNRWGEKLFETNDVKVGWDGTYKGKLLDQGVYGYYMTFTCNNGEQSFKKGNITLMR